MADYAKFLFTRFILMPFKKVCDEVHIIFDNPGRLKNTPKYFERQRREISAIVQVNHCCDAITSTTKIPSKWRENLLHCRVCKRSLVKYLTHFFLHYMHKYLSQNQTMYVAGGFDDAIQVIHAGTLQTPKNPNQNQGTPAMPKKLVPEYGYM